MDKIVYACKQRECHLAAVLLRIQQRRLVGIGHEAALRHNCGIVAVITEEKLLAAELYLAVVIGLEKLPEPALQRPCKDFACAVAARIEHLGAFVFRVGELVLVDGYTDRIAALVEHGEPVVHVGAFLCGDALNSLVVYGPVGVPCYPDLIAVDFKDISEPEKYVKVYALFGDSLRRGAAAVDTAVWRININLVVFMA